MGGHAPSEYLRRIEEEANQYALLLLLENVDTEEIFASHLICTDAAAALQNNEFWRFFNARKQALLKVIAEAMGKPVVRDEDDNSDASA